MCLTSFSSVVSSLDTIIARFTKPTIFNHARLDSWCESGKPYLPVRVCIGLILVCGVYHLRSLWNGRPWTEVSLFFFLHWELDVWMLFISMVDQYVGFLRLVWQLQWRHSQISSIHVVAGKYFQQTGLCLQNCPWKYRKPREKHESQLLPHPAVGNAGCCSGRMLKWGRNETELLWWGHLWWWVSNSGKSCICV